MNVLLPYLVLTSKALTLWSLFLCSVLKFIARVPSVYIYADINKF
jgi:hypothetical protein